MNCFYFAMERCRTFKENKKIKQKKETKTKTNTKNKNWNKYKKQNKKTTDKQTNQNKTKRKYTNERTKNTLHTLTKVLTSCHTSIENQKESHMRSFQVLNSYPFRNILLRIQGDTSIDIPWV